MQFCVYLIFYSDCFARAERARKEEIIIQIIILKKYDFKVFKFLSFFAERRLIFRSKKHFRFFITRYTSVKLCKSNRAYKYISPRFLLDNKTFRRGLFSCRSPVASSWLSCRQASYTRQDFVSTLRMFQWSMQLCL